MLGMYAPQVTTLVIALYNCTKLSLMASFSWTVILPLAFILAKSLMALCAPYTLVINIYVNI